MSGDPEPNQTAATGAEVRHRATATLRAAVDGDLEAIADLWFRGWRDGHEGRVPAALVEHRTRASFTPRTRERLRETLVAELVGIVVGFAVVVDDEVEQVYVDQIARGTGVAAQLLRAAESAVAAAGHSSAWLAVVPGNDRARRFYAKHGWRDDGPFTYQADTTTGPVDVPAHRYVRDIADPSLG